MRIGACVAVTREVLGTGGNALRLHTLSHHSSLAGYGLRIFARFLRDTGRVHDAPFRLVTLGGMVTCQCLEDGRMVRVEMGAVTFRSTEIPMSGPDREVLGETRTVRGQTLTLCAASVGNPHCVVLCDTIDEALARRLGPLLETAPCFPRRTNVQFLRVLDKHAIAIEIWERGAGYTLASGSSASAAAAVASVLISAARGRDVTVEPPPHESAIDPEPRIAHYFVLVSFNIDCFFLLLRDPDRSLAH